MARIRIQGVVASTHPMESYGGVRISKELVESLAEKLRAGEIPFGVRHDPRVRLGAVVVDVATRVRLSEGCVISGRSGHAAKRRSSMLAGS